MSEDAHDIGNDYIWTCPCCFSRGIADSTIARASDRTLDEAVTLHIQEAHEDTIARRAVDRARMQCSKVDCEIGRTKVYDLKTSAHVLRLTDFDQKLLEGMRIRWE